MGGETTSRFDAAVAGFYKAAFGSIGWREALAAASGVLRASYGMQLVGVDAAGSLVFSFEAGAASAEALFEWLRHWHRFDPRTALLLQLPEGAWVHCDEHFDEAYVAASPFYQELMLPYGGRWVSGVKLHQDASIAVLWAILNRVGTPPLGADERAVAQRLAAHLAEAVKLYLRQRQLRQQAHAGAELLRHFRHPTLLVDELRRIRFANEPARALLADGAVLQQRQGLLAGRDAAADAQLLLALRGLRLAGDAYLEQQPARDRVFLRVADAAGRPLALYLCALRPESTLAAFGPQPLAMLLLHDPRRHPELDPFLVAATWDLTAAEARVAVALAEGLSPEAVARRHGVAVGTVRCQIKAAQAKTGTRRQAELVSLLLAMPTGLAPPPGLLASP